MQLIRSEYADHAGSNHKCQSCVVNLTSQIFEYKQACREKHVSQFCLELISTLLEEKALLDDRQRLRV